LGSFGTQIEAQRDRTSILREFSNGRKAIERLEKEFREMVKTIVRAGMDDAIPQLHFAERDNRTLETRYLNDPDLQFQLKDSVVNSRTVELPEPKLKAVCRKQLSDETQIPQVNRSAILAPSRKKIDRGNMLAGKQLCLFEVRFSAARK